MIARKRFITYAAGFAILGFLLTGHMPLGQLIWPPGDMEGLTPSGPQIGLLMGYSIVAAIGFGIGIAWLLLGWPVMKRVNVSPGITLAAHLSIVWITASWVPHDALHMFFGMNLWALIGLEWGFHATLIIAGALLARFAYTSVISPKPAKSPAPDKAAAAQGTRT